MISEAERLTREFYTAVATRYTEHEPADLEEVATFASRFCEMEPTTIEEGLIFVMVGRSLVAGEFNARQMRASAQSAEEYAAVIEVLDWLTLAAIEILSKGLHVLGTKNEIMVNPEDYVPDSLKNPILN